MKTNRNIDFFVIGAQKAGTTSLHKLLSKHPGITLPVAKEAPFFSRPELYAKGIDWYIKEFFPRKRGAQMLGTVTPQYMAYPQVAAKMRQHCPDAKIIAILRDPIERARSHFKMRVRAFGELRAFKQAILERLTPESLSANREKTTPSNSYITWGEYGRILSEFLAYFPPNQLLVTFLDKLEKEPGKTLDSIFDFLGLATITIENPDKRYNVGYKARRLSVSGLLANATRNKTIRGLGNKLIPARLMHRLSFWSIINRNTSVMANPAEISLSDEILMLLDNHYRADLQVLENLGLGPIPWCERNTSDGN